MLLAWAVLIAQTPPAAPGATFDAVSVKANTSGASRMSAGARGRTYSAVNTPLRRIIAAAYQLDFSEAYRLVGGPGWIDSGRFDVTATLPENTSARELPSMLRALLAERFKLVAHTETREAPLYSLMVARGDRALGPQLRTAPVDCEAARPGPDVCRLEVSDRIAGRGQRMSALARVLGGFAGRYVVDRTDLSGGFDFDLTFPDLAAGSRGGGPGGDSGGGVFTALQEQLGLKLTATKGPLDFVVIDRVEQPSEN